MEKCKYSGVEYHPMLRATKDGSLIYVCEFMWTDVDGKTKLIQTDECKKKAEADGYTLRRDLTPSR